jgi:hypothetical protein
MDIDDLLTTTRSARKTLHLNEADGVRELLGIPDTYVQGCLLPVARLKPGTAFKRAPRRPLDDVIAVDAWA